MAWSASQRRERGAAALQVWNAHPANGPRATLQKKIVAGRELARVVQSLVGTDATHESSAVVAQRIVDDNYGSSSPYATPNEYDEVGLTLALARGDVDADGILAMLIRAVDAGIHLAQESWEPDERAPEPRIVVDPDDTAWSFNVEDGLVIIWEGPAGDREFVLGGNATRAELIAALAKVDAPPTPFPILTHDARTNGAGQ